MNQEQLEIEKNLTSLLTQLGIQYNEDKIAQLKALYSSQKRAKNSLQPIKQLYEIEEEEKQLNDLLVQTKKVADQLQEKIIKQKEQRDLKTQTLNESLEKVRLIQQIYKIKKQTEDIQGESQPLKTFLNLYDEKMKDQIKQRFNREATSLNETYKQMVEEKNRIQLKIWEIEQQKKLREVEIEKQKQKGQDIKRTEEQLSRKIECLKEEEEKRKLFIEREKSRKQMKFFSSLSEGSMDNSFSSERSEKVVLEELKLPRNEWEKNKYYIVILGLWTLALGGFSMF